MANTGNKVYNYLQERLVSNNSLTGNRKVNDISDPDYIAPVEDHTHCPPDPDTHYVEFEMLIDIGEHPDGYIELDAIDLGLAAVSVIDGTTFDDVGITQFVVTIDSGLYPPNTNIQTAFKAYIDNPTYQGEKLYLEAVRGDSIYVDRVEHTFSTPPYENTSWSLSWDWDYLGDTSRLRFTDTPAGLPVTVDVQLGAGSGVYFSLLSQSHNFGASLLGTGIHTGNYWLTSPNNSQFEWPAGETIVVDVNQTGDVYLELILNGSVIETFTITGPVYGANKIIAQFDHLLGDTLTIRLADTQTV